MISPPRTYAFAGRSCVIASASVVFPQPLSPTRPTVSPSSTSRLTPSTARTQPFWTLKWTFRLRTERRGTSTPPQARVDDLIEAATQEIEAEGKEGDRETGREEPPPVVQPAPQGDEGRQHATPGGHVRVIDRKSTRLNSSHGYISYAVFCLK